MPNENRPLFTRVLGKGTNKPCFLLVEVDPYGVVSNQRGVGVHTGLTKRRPKGIWAESSPGQAEASGGKNAGMFSGKSHSSSRREEIGAAKKFSYAEEIRSERGAVDSQDSLGFHGHFRADLACAVFPASKRAGGDAKLPRHIGGGEAVRLPISP